MWKGRDLASSETRRRRAYCLVMLLACGCGLSKEDARGVIEAEYYAKDATVSCSWKDVPAQAERGSGASAEYVPGAAHAECVDALEKAGIVKRVPCAGKRAWDSVECEGNDFALGKGTFTPGAVHFDCGTKRLGEVTSIATEGKTAHVKYRRIVILNKELISSLPCVLDTPQEGAEEVKVTLVRDDDGRWTPP